MLKKLFFFLLIIGGVGYGYLSYTHTDIHQLVTTVQSGKVLGVSTQNGNATKGVAKAVGNQAEAVKEKGMNMKVGDVVNGVSASVTFIHAILNFGNSIREQIGHMVKPH